MARIAIVRIRTAHDAEIRLNRLAQFALSALGGKSTLSRAKAFEGYPALAQMTGPYLAGLVDQYNERFGKCHETVLVDEPESSVRHVLKHREPYDMVWLTTNTPLAPATYRLSAELSRAGLVTVIGGIHASVLPEEAARYATCIVMGEAESVIPELLGDLDRNGSIKTKYRGGHARTLDGLPGARWDKLDYRPAILCMQTSRGCKNACSFCSTTRFQGTRRRHRPVKEVVEEIRRYQDLGYLEETTIFFTDNNIVSDTDHRRGNVDTSYARELFEALVPLKIFWSGQGEVGFGDDQELVELAAESGLVTLLVGLETLEQSNLETVNKPSNMVERYAEQIGVLRSYGISLIGCFIFGMENDSTNVFDRTFEFIQQHVDAPQLSIMTPYPGTALYKRLEKEGRILHRDWSRYDILNVTYQPARMPPEELQASRGFRVVCTIFLVSSNVPYGLPTPSTEAVQPRNHGCRGLRGHWGPTSTTVLCRRVFAPDPAANIPEGEGEIDAGDLPA